MSDSKEILEGNKTCGIIMDDCHGNDFSGMQVRNFDIGASLSKSNHNNFSNTSFINDKEFHETIDKIKQELSSSITVDEFEKISPSIKQMRENYKKSNFKEAYIKFIEVTAQHVAIVSPFLPCLAQYLK